MEDICKKYIESVVDDKKDWYAIRLFTTKIEEVEQFFRRRGLETFVPKQ